MRINFLKLSSLLFLTGCDAIVDAENRQKTLLCEIVEESQSYRLFFNHTENGTGIAPLGNGTVRLDTFDPNIPGMVSVNLSRVDDGRRFQRSTWSTPFALSNGVKGEIIDMPYNSCISDYFAKNAPYRIVITDWGNSVGPYTTPVVPIGCCFEIDT